MLRLLTILPFQALNVSLHSPQIIVLSPLWPLHISTNLGLVGPVRFGVVGFCLFQFSFLVQVARQCNLDLPREDLFRRQ